MISSISPNNQRQNTSFGRALSTKELIHFHEIYTQSQKALNKSLGIEKDSKVFIMPDFSMPDIDSENTGMGRLFSDSTQKFAKFIKNYFQADAIQVLPQNKFKGVDDKNYFSPYSAQGAAFSEHVISFKELTKKEFGEIITKQEFDNLVQKNAKKDTVNAENEIGFEGKISPKLELLKISFERFKKNNTPELNKLHQEFNTYKNDPIEAKRFENIFKGQNYSTDEKEFFKFWQFLADNHHQKGREVLKKEGLELIGDCQIGFLYRDNVSNPEAFKGFNEWGSPEINPERIFKKDGSLDIAGEVLKEKFTFFLKRYDGIRFDVGDRYTQYGSAIGHPEKVLELIEATAKEVKGPDFDLNKLSYENGKGNPFATRVKIYQNFSLNPTSNDLTQVGLGNHDNLDKACAITEAKKISPNNFQEIVKEKFGKLMTYPRKFIFFDDFFGKERVFNYENQHPGNPKSFRQKLSPNFEEEYHTALQKGDGFNLMESLAIAMKKQGIDKTEPELFKQVVQQGQILREPGSKTQKSADTIQEKKDLKELLPKIAVGLAAASAIAISIILIKNKRTQAQTPIETKPQDEYVINPQYQYLRATQYRRNPLI